MRALFWGLGADGTVSANKNSIKIIGEETPNYAQGYFVYDSKKSGAMTVSHLRFGHTSDPKHLSDPARELHRRSSVQLSRALRRSGRGRRWRNLAAEQSLFTGQRFGTICHVRFRNRSSPSGSRFYSIDAYAVAKEKQLGNRINTIMQTCFFAISGVLPRDEAIAKIKESIRKTYGKRGEPVVRQNFAAVDAALEHLHEVLCPSRSHQHFRSATCRSSSGPGICATSHGRNHRGSRRPVCR